MNSVDALRDVVAGAIVDRAIEVSRQLADLGVPHVLIGGLAVGIHGHRDRQGFGDGQWTFHGWASSGNSYEDFESETEDDELHLQPAVPWPL